MNKIIEEKYILKSNKIDKDIVLTILTDIHYSYSFDNKKLDILLNYVRSSKPDYICIPGDFLDSPKCLNKETEEILKEWLKGLGKVAHVIICLGNHDFTLEERKLFSYKVSYNCNIDFYRSLNNIDNVYFLDNEIKEFKDILFNGFSLSFNYYFKGNKCKEDLNTLIKDYNNLKSIDNKKYNVMLCHSPEYIMHNDVVKKYTSFKNYDLIISGHMHSGVIRFKNNKGLINPQKKFMQDNCSGLTKRNNTNLLVARQVTTFSGITPKIFQLCNVFFPIYTTKIIIKRG